VPAEGEETVDELSSPGAADSRVNLNTADAATLETLPRIGPALAGRIIDWRDQHGRFTSVDDLLAVAGIGEKLLSGLRDQVTV
jgi:competence protein ComEA